MHYVIGDIASDTETVLFEGTWADCHRWAINYLMSDDGGYRTIAVIDNQRDGEIIYERDEDGEKWSNV